MEQIKENKLNVEIGLITAIIKNEFKLVRVNWI